MDLYVILRRSGWRSPEDLGEAAGRSKEVADADMPDDIKWIRSYVLEEGGGSVGTVCIYQASSPEAIRKHAKLADLPVDEIIAVADTVVIRPDPAAGQRLTRPLGALSGAGGGDQRGRRPRSVGSAVVPRDATVTTPLLLINAPVYAAVIVRRPTSSAVVATLAVPPVSAVDGPIVVGLR